MKKTIAFLLTLALCAGLVACAPAAAPVAEAPVAEAPAVEAPAAEAPVAEAPAGDITAGACWYNFADTFIGNARQTLANIAAADGTIKVSDADSLFDIATQTSNMNNFFTQDVDYLILNNINTNATSEIVQQCKAEDTTLILVNTNTFEDSDLESYDKLYSVSSYSPQSGTVMGEALVEYWNANPQADRNGNGKLDYIMLLGIVGHYDTIVRAEYSIKALTDAGIEVNNIGGEVVADYSRATAQEKTAALIANYSEDVDAIIACSDDMALGAIEALKAGGFFGDDAHYIPVCGVDATAVGCEAIAEGTMLVTALNDPTVLARATYKVMYLLSKGEEITTESVGLKDVRVEGHRVWISYTPITKDNLDVAKYDINDVSF